MTSASISGPDARRISAGIFVRIELIRASNLSSVVSGVVAALASLSCSWCCWGEDTMSSLMVNFNLSLSFRGGFGRIGGLVAKPAVTC